MDKATLKARLKLRFPEVAAASDPQDKLCEILADEFIQHLIDHGVIKVGSEEGTIE